MYNSEKDIRGVSRQKVMLIEITEIKKEGWETQMYPHLKGLWFVRYVLVPKDVGENTIIKTVAKESLCYVTFQTFFTINSYEILE